MLFLTESDVRELLPMTKAIELMEGAFQRMAAMLKTDGLLYLRDTVFSFEPTEYREHIDAWITLMGNGSEVPE